MTVHTRFDTFHQTSSLLDPSVYMDVACEVLSDRLGSDHHPIIITASTSDYPVPERVPKWNFKKAKWDAFQDQCITEITPDLFNDAEDKMAIFSNTLLDIAADNIPKTSPFPGDGGGRPSSVMSLGVTSVGGHSHGHPASPIGVGSSWEDIDPRSPEPLVVRGGWLWLIWVVRWTT